MVDLAMPGMTGAEIAVRARALDPAISIIAISGEQVPEMIRQVAAVGMHTFLRKPFATRDLVRAIGLARGDPSRAQERRAAGG